MKNNRNVVLFIAFIFSLSIFAQPTYSQTPTYDGLNILFIVDQSGSMGGVRYGGDSIYGEGYDPADLRFFGPQYVLEWLSSYVRATTGIDRPEVNIAMVNFGTEPRPIMDWTNVDLDFLNAPEVDRDNIVNALSRNRYFNPATGEYENLVWTNHRQAFRFAKTVYDGAPKAPVGEQYLTVVIMLTDGSPCMPNENCDNLGNDGFAAGHLTNIAPEVHSAFPQSRVYVVGIDASDAYWSALLPYWETVACPDPASCDRDLQLKQTVTEPEIATHFNEILTNLVGLLGNVNVTSQNLNPPQDFFVQPYSQSMQLNVFKSVSEPLNNAIELLQPDDQVPIDLNPSGLDTPIEIYQIDNPIPGDWSINFDSSALSNVQTVNFVVDQINVGAEMRVDNQPAGNASTIDIDQYEATPLAVAIIDGGGIAVERYGDSNGDGQPDYPLTVVAKIYDATLTDPSSRPLIETVTLEDDTTLPAQNYFVTSWMPSLADTPFEARVDVSYIDDAGLTQYLLQDYPVYEGFRANEVVFITTGPNTNSVLQDSAIEIQTAIQRKATAQTVDWLLPNTVTQIEVLDDTGTSISTVLLPNTSTEAGTITADVVLTTPGQFELVTEVGVVDDAGNFISYSALPSTYPIQVRPKQSLSVNITVSPDEESVPAQALDVQVFPPQLWRTTSTTIQVEIINEYTNSPVSLSSLTNGAVDRPVVILNNNDISGDLQEVSPGVYALTRDDLGMGEQEIEASAASSSANLIEDYEWQNPTAALTQNRTLAGFIWQGILALLVALGMLAFAGVLLKRRHTKITSLPLKGDLTLIKRYVETQEYDIVTTIQLTELNRNKLTFTSKHFYDLGFTVTIESPEDEKQHKDGIAVVTRLINPSGQEVASDLKPMRLHPAEYSRVVYTDEEYNDYMLVKDFESTTFIGGGGASDDVIF